MTQKRAKMPGEPVTGRVPLQPHQPCLEACLPQRRGHLRERTPAVPSIASSFRHWDDPGLLLPILTLIFPLKSRTHGHSGSLLSPSLSAPGPSDLAHCQGGHQWVVGSHFPLEPQVCPPHARRHDRLRRGPWTQRGRPGAGGRLCAPSHKAWGSQPLLSPPTPHRRSASSTEVWP